MGIYFLQTNQKEAKMKLNAHDQKCVDQLKSMPGIKTTTRMPSRGEVIASLQKSGRRAAAFEESIRQRQSTSK